jgi:hypothetical protein
MVSRRSRLVITTLCCQIGIDFLMGRVAAWPCLPRHFSISPISKTFVPPTQWSTSSSHFFAGKMHQVTSRPVRSVGLPTLRL